MNKLFILRPNGERIYHLRDDGSVWEGDDELASKVQLAWAKRGLFLSVEPSWEKPLRDVMFGIHNTIRSN
jgi:hypothetical protein